MNIQRSDIELMAPAGDFESLRAALQAGADAVYFGVGRLNMRSGSARNFSLSDLAEIARLCRENGAKSYLTLNVVVYDEELDDLRSLIGAASKAGISAVIAGDMAVIGLARAAGIPVHLSTQANVSNLEALRFFAGFAEVMVLARELSLQQVAHICRAVAGEPIHGPDGRPVRIEVFVHGALCMAISGKCYLSLHQQGKSANRGVCRQECRKAYEVIEKESGKSLEVDNEYIMSPKDLCTIGFLDQVIAAGARVLKIEGRGRSPEYVHTVTRCYDQALRAISEGRFSEELVKTWEKELEWVFNRGFWDGWYLGQTLGEWSDRHGSHATRRKVYVGKGLNYFPKAGVGEFLIEAHPLRVGDEVIVTGPTTGLIECRVEEIRVDLQPVEECPQGQRCSIPLPRKIRPSDRLYKMVENSPLSAY
jgi:U32 family peptidase